MTTPASRPSAPPSDPRATPSAWRGAWNNWIAPFHACPHCGASLSWGQHEDVFDRPVIDASCCGIHFAVQLTWQPVAPAPRSGDGDPPPPEQAFVYLLNAMERAAQEDTPAEHGYAKKRAAVLAYVARLGNLLSTAEAVAHEYERQLDAVLASQRAARARAEQDSPALLQALAIAEESNEAWGQRIASLIRLHLTTENPHVG